MSIKSALESNVDNYSKYHSRQSKASQRRDLTWIRNPSWVSLPAVANTEQKIVGVYMVSNANSNFAAFTISGNYNVNWGDGVSENISSGVTAYHEYSYSDTDLDNSNAPVTLTDSGDLISRTNHGYTNGMSVKFYNIVSTTGLTEGQVYYIINANTNDFQVSETVGGSSVVLTTNGTATLLEYKQALITITPQASANLTSLNFNVKHSKTNLNAYSTGWLDMLISAPLATTLTIGASTPTVYFNNLERVNIISSAITTYANKFQNLAILENVAITSSANVTSTSSMFSGCSALTTVPLFNTANVTTMASMFSGCSALLSVPLFNTVSVTSTSLMFNSCSALTTVPLFNTANITNMASMFSGCSALLSVPLFNTVSVTSTSSMFSGCSTLTTVPLFNTANVTTMTSMFNSCSTLTTVPLFNTANVTTIQSMFQSCSALTTVPLFNTASVTTIQSMFQSCRNLRCVPAMNCASITSSGFSTMLSTAPSIERVLLNNVAITLSLTTLNLSKTELESFFNNLATANTVAGATLTITTNHGIGNSVSKSCTTTAGSNNVTISDTVGITNGMQMTGGGSPITANLAVTFTDAGDLVNAIAHGLLNGDQVSFNSIVSTTGLTEWKVYYVINANANDFQVSLTIGGSAITLTTNGSGQMRYTTTVQSIVVNTSITLSRVAPVSNTSSHTFRELITAPALLKQWTISG